MAPGNHTYSTTPHCAHMPMHSALAIAGRSIQEGVLEMEMLSIYTQSLKATEEGRPLNKVGYHGEMVRAVQRAYGDDCLTADMRTELFNHAPENHAGLEILIGKEFPALYRDIQRSKRLRN